MLYRIRGRQSATIEANADGLVDVFAIESKGRPLGPTDAGVACDEAIERLCQEIACTHAHASHGNLPVVRADHVQLVCLFQNLIDNALKYHGAEAPQVEIRCKHRDDDWVFRVTDNGIGIDPRFHEKIFIIFQKLHPRDTYSGTGIGLALCKRIVERAGGRMWVESSTGTGSAFCFTFPAVAEPSASPVSNEGAASEQVASDLR